MDMDPSGNWAATRLAQLQQQAQELQAPPLVNPTRDELNKEAESLFYSFQETDARRQYELKRHAVRVRDDSSLEEDEDERQDEIPSSQEPDSQPSTWSSPSTAHKGYSHLHSLFDS